MPNQLLTTDVIAKEATMVLENNLVLGNKVYKNYQDEFVSGVGDTIKIKKPTKGEVKDFKGSTEDRDVEEENITLKIDRHKYDKIKLTTKELALSVSAFSEQFLVPMLREFAQTIDYDLATLAKKVPYFVGTAGAAPGQISDLTNLGQVLDDNNVPESGRSLVINSAAKNNFLQLQTFHEADKLGSTDGLKNAALGKKLGFDIYSKQNMYRHKNGTLAVSGAPEISSDVEAGDSRIFVQDTTLTGTVTKGSRLEIDGAQYIVTSDATASEDEIILNIYPSMPKTMENGSPVTFLDDHNCNLAFNSRAIALASAPLEPLWGTDTAWASYNGIVIRISKSGSISNLSNYMVLDCVYAADLIQPELAAVLLG